jgi:hypothetical protein
MHWHCTMFGFKQCLGVNINATVTVAIFVDFVFDGHGLESKTYHAENKILKEYLKQDVALYVQSKSTVPFRIK